MKLTFTDFHRNQSISFVHGIEVGRSFVTHIHESVCVGAVLNGLRTMKFGKQSVTIKSGEVFFVNSGEPHSVESGQNPHEYFVVTINSHKISRLKILNIIRDEQIYRGLLRIITLCDEKKTGQLTNSVNDLLERIALNYSLPESDSSKENYYERVRYVKDKIAESPFENISISAMAAMACMSQFHFSRIFRQITGMPPHRYQTMTKIKRGIKMLSDGKSIADIVYEAGFVDQSHLTKQFTVYAGLPPLRYKKNRVLLK